MNTLTPKLLNTIDAEVPRRSVEREGHHFCVALPSWRPMRFGNATNECNADTTIGRSKYLILALGILNTERNIFSFKVEFAAFRALRVTFHGVANVFAAIVTWNK